MERLFATHLAQNAFKISIPGQYDPEQELWVADNQLQGTINPYLTVHVTGTTASVGTTLSTAIATGMISDSDSTLETKTASDLDSAPDA